MSTDRNPDEIQEEIRNTRARMDETLEAIEHQFSPGELLDKSLAYLKAPGGYASELTSNLGEKVKENPLPLALVGIGLGWLMMSNGRGSDSRDSYSRSAYADADDYRSRPRQVGAGPRGPLISPSGDYYEEASRSGLKDTAEKAGEQISGKARTVKEGAKATAQSVKERANAATDAAAETLSAAGDRVEKTWRDARAATGDAAGRAQYQVGRMGQQGQRKLQHAQREFDRLTQEQPLVLGALGLMAGVAAGASLPPTRREDEMVGEYRDNLVDEAAAQGEVYKQKAQRVADAALEEGSREARSQGITEQGGKESASKAKETVKEQLRKAEEKIERVGNAAYDAAKREAERQDLKQPDTNSTAAPSGSS